MAITNYERVEHRVEKTVPCRVCGKKIKRATTLGQTINPWNKNADGTVKNRYQIQAELKQRAETWHPVNDIHGKCVRAERDAQAAEAAS